MNRRLAAATLLAALAGCHVGGPPETTGTGRVLILNGARSAGALRVYLDGQAQGRIDLGNVGTIGQIGGSHTLEIRRGDNSASHVRALDVDSFETVSLVVFDSVGVLTSYALSDTGAIVPAGSSKLRVAHFAGAAPPIDVWRTQPGTPTPTRVVFPFAYLTESAYVQSTSGVWRVMVSDTVPAATPSASIPDTLAITQPISIPSGSSRTVVVIDGQPGGVYLIVLNP